MNLRRAAPSITGFTLRELIAIGTVFSFFFVLASASSGTTMTNSRSLLCVGNLRQLTQAWMMYAEANDGHLPANRFGQTFQSESRQWAPGWLDWTASAANTDAASLANGSLGVYLQRNTRVFKCPADTFVSPAARMQGQRERVRSYAMNGFVGDAVGFHQSTRWTRYLNLNDIAAPAPNKLLLIGDEHPDSMNDGHLVLSPDDLSWIDLPGSHHGGACNWSFADGHVENKVWETTALRPVKMTSYNVVRVSPNDPDYLWVTQRASFRK